MKLADLLGLGENVIFDKWMSRENLLNAIVTSDVFMFAGLRDGGGAVVVEAMSVGKPVVCLAIGGPEMHVDDCTGFKIAATTPEESINGMAEALVRLHNDESLLKLMGESAKEKARDFYLWDRAGDRLKSIYDQIILSEAKIKTS